MTEAASTTKALPRVFISTGDPSGDVHASKVVRALRDISPEVDLLAVGGKELSALNVPLVSNQDQMGVLGIASLLSVFTHLMLAQKVLKHLETFKPDAILLIDYGGYHLWLAEQLKKHPTLKHVPVYYFIPPQIWASRKERIKKIKNFVDHVFCIFPFEEDYYKREDIPVTYVGHPLIGSLPPAVDKLFFAEQHTIDPLKPVIGVFPGSRKMEIKYLLKPMLQSVKRLKESYPEWQFVLAKAKALDSAWFDKRFKSMSEQLGLSSLDVRVLEGVHHELLSISDAAMLASGTVTLEAALYNTPHVLMYRGNPIVHQIALRMIYLPCIGLPNILTDMENPICKELWQYDVIADNIVPEIEKLVPSDSPERKRALEGFNAIRKKLSISNATTKVAEVIFKNATLAKLTKESE